MMSPGNFQPPADPDSSTPPVQQLFDATKCQAATVDKLDMQQIRDFLKRDSVRLQDDYRADVDEQQQMEGLGLLLEGRASYGALLCFGQNPPLQIAGASTRCIDWGKDTERKPLTGPSKDDQEYRDSLLLQFVRARNFLIKHLDDQVSQGDTPTRGKLYSRVLDEVLANALVHREYVVTGPNNRTPSAPCVQVDIFGDRIEIHSPGGSPIDISVLQQASEQHPHSHPRNPQIMRIFYLAGHVDRVGTGIARMQRWMKEAGLQKPTLRFNEQTKMFSVTLYRPATSDTGPSKSHRTDKHDRDGKNNIRELNGPQQSQLGDALLSAFPTRQDLAMMVSYGLDKHLSAIVSGEGNLQHTIFQLIQWSIANGRLKELIDSALQHSGQNPQLRDFVEQLKRENGHRLTPDTLTKEPVQPPIRGKNGPKPGQDGNANHLSRHHLPKVLLSIILILALGLGVIGLLNLPHSSPTSTPLPSSIIEIASELPASGVDKTIGLPVQNGVQMAIDDANHNQLLPGYTLKLTPYDDVGKDNRHDSQIGTSNLDKVIRDNLVAGVVGPYNSIIARAEMPIANRASLALISPATTYPCLTKSFSNDTDCAGQFDIAEQMRPTKQLTYFRLATTDDREGKAAADYFFDMLHAQMLHTPKVLLIKDQSDLYSFGLSQAFENEWTRLDGQVVSINLLETTKNIQDYQDALQAKSSTQPDLIYFSGNDPNGTYVLEALSNIPQLNGVTFAGAGGTMNDNFLKVAVQRHSSAPVYMSLPIQDPAHSKTSVGIDFERNYTASGYQDYRPYAASAYDCTMMLIQAIQKALQKKGITTPHGAQDQTGARQFRQAVLQELAHLSYTGATGTHSFDGNGDTSNHHLTLYRMDIVNSQGEWTWLQQVAA